MATTAAALPQRSPWVLVIAGCLIAMVTLGVRAIFGLFVEPLSQAHGWGREIFAFAIALQNLVWGAAQPFAGAFADRFGAARVLAGGGLVYAAGVVLMAMSPTPLAVTLSGGVIVGLGLAGASFTIVLAALGRLLPTHKRSWGLGIATASGSLGQFLFAPVGQAFISGYGWQTALMLLALFVAVVPLMSPPLAGRADQTVDADEADLRFTDALRLAGGHGSYWLLVAGFFVCGFHVTFIAVHLPPYLVDLGVGSSIAAWAIGVIGLFNVVGAYASGVLGGRHSKRHLLSLLYTGRAAAIAVFLVLPKTPLVVLGFGAIMGLLWLSTVPLTSGLVAVMFGTRYLGTLFGFVFFSHQVGAFLGVWLGGFVYERTGSYDPVWWLGIALGLFAALVHWPIRERRVPAFAAAVSPVRDS
jgi:MFS family permease